MELNERELATVLHALRSLQEHDACKCEGDHFSNAEELTAEEIDDLCERINCQSQLGIATFAEILRKNIKFFLEHGHDSDPLKPR
jgi:hypothetical protein